MRYHPFCDTAYDERTSAVGGRHVESPEDRQRDVAGGIAERWLRRLHSRVRTVRLMEGTRAQPVH